MRPPRHRLASAAMGSVLLVCTAVQAEQPDYRFASVRTISGPGGGDSGDDLAIDVNGAVLVVGHHSGLDTNNDGQVDVESSGMTDPLIIPSHPNGDGKWLRSPGGPEYDTGQGIAPDGTGGVYIVGSFKQNLRFLSDETIVSSGSADGYLARYDATVTERPLPRLVTST